MNWHFLPTLVCGGRLWKFLVQIVVIQLVRKPLSGDCKGKEGLHRMEGGALVAEKFVIDEQLHLVIETDNAFSSTNVHSLDLAAKSGHLKQILWLIKIKGDFLDALVDSLNQNIRRLFLLLVIFESKVILKVHQGIALQIRVLHVNVV